MKEELGHIDKLILDYLNNEASEENQRELLLWINSSNENKRYFLDMKDIWDSSAFINNKNLFNPEKSFSKLDNLFADNNQHKVIKTKPLKRYLYVAASIAAAFVISWQVFLKNTDSIETITVTANNMVITDTLSDGSIASLNKNSEITYYSDYYINSREIHLSGEAFFDVSHNKEKPFKVFAGDIIVEVLGTSFNVDELTNSSVIYITVNTGIVKVSVNDSSGVSDNTVTLTANEEAVYNKEKKTLTKTEASNKNYLSWKNGTLHFKDDSMKMVIAALEKHYGVTIVVKNVKLFKCKLTATFTNQSLDDVCEALEALFQIEIIRENNTLYFEGENCN